MALVRHNPWGVGQLQDEINRLFRNLDHAESSGVTAGWVPAVDIREFGDRYHMFIDLPGVDPKGVEITLDNGVLTITGERAHPEVPEGDRTVSHRSERGYGHFHRRFILPDTVDAENVRAVDRHGVLEVTIPKHAKAQPKRIKVAA